MFTKETVGGTFKVVFWEVFFGCGVLFFFTGRC